MKRMIKVLAVSVLIAVILVASISPALARPRHFGKNLHDNPSCETTDKAQNAGGAQHEVDPKDPSAKPRLERGCWVVLPS